MGEQNGSTLKDKLSKFRYIIDGGMIDKDGAPLGLQKTKLGDCVYATVSDPVQAQLLSGMFKIKSCSTQAFKDIPEDTLRCSFMTGVAQKSTELTRNIDVKVIELERDSMKIIYSEPMRLVNHSSVDDEGHSHSATYLQAVIM